MLLTNRFQTYRREIAATAGVAAFLLLLAFCGCALRPASPLVGTWTGGMVALHPGQTISPGVLPDGAKAAMPTATLTLKEGGNGYLKMPYMPEQAVHWKQDDNKVIFAYGLAPSPPGDAASVSGPNIVATLSDDKKTLSMEMALFGLELHKQLAKE